MSEHTSQPLGKHLLVDYFECDSALIDDLSLIESVLVEAAKLTGAQVLNKVLHKFSPQGVSGVVVISESHVAIHTWPEFGTVSVDFFTCNVHMQTQNSITYLQNKFKASHYKTTEIDRGRIFV